MSLPRALIIKQHFSFSSAAVFGGYWRDRWIFSKHSSWADLRLRSGSARPVCRSSREQKQTSSHDYTAICLAWMQINTNTVGTTRPLLSGRTRVKFSHWITPRTTIGHLLMFNRGMGPPTHTQLSNSGGRCGAPLPVARKVLNHSDIVGIPRAAACICDPLTLSDYALLLVALIGFLCTCTLWATREWRGGTAG